MDPNAINSTEGPAAPHPPPFVLLDYLLPGFSVFSSAVQAYLGIDLNLYIPLLLVISGLTFAWTYVQEYAWGMVEKYLMSVVRIRTDDEIYNMIMTWVAQQRFAQSSRSFIVNTNVNSRSWFLFRWNDEEEDDTEGDESNGLMAKKKPLQYTPSFGSHFFWYNGRLLLFERHENREQSGFLVVSERVEISISCFGRNPRVLKELLIEARSQYTKRDESKTLIYRAASGNNAGNSGEPTWQRCMSRSSRPFSTVILNEKAKTDLIDDVTDYLNPATRRWYSNRGIPYRRGYLLYGPPGTGKSSLSLALAGFFQMRIYMVSLSSIIANEENLSSLFAELPRRCVVLLEDIDSAGLTHTREEKSNATEGEEPPVSTVQNGPGKPAVPVTGNRLSLSGLLNILDGVASQEGRILIMTTNHLEKLDKALIRPGRVDMIVQFGLADSGMVASIFRAIYAPYDGEDIPGIDASTKAELVDEDKANALAEKEAKARQEMVDRIDALAKKFADKIPEHEFSPAEIQGLLLKHKRNPDAVIEAADEWVVETRKEKKEKEIEDAKKRREEDEKQRKEEADKKKEEEKAKRKEEKKKARKKAAKAKRKAEGKESGSGSGSGSGSDSDSDSDSDTEEVSRKDSENESKGDEASKEKMDEKNDKKVETSEQKADDKKLEAVVVEKAIDGDKNPKGTSDSGYDTPEHAS